MSDPHVLTSLENGVLQLTLNRPEKRNALSFEMYDALLAALESAATDAAVRCVVLTGAGGSFCAGGDVGRMSGGQVQELTFDEKVARLRGRTRIVELLHTMAKPSVAMMRGPAVGAGLSLALACDVRVGDPSTFVKTGFLQVGLSGDFGGHYFLARAVGPARARELYLLPDRVEAADCLRLGVLNRLTAPERLQEDVAAIARAWANASAPALAHIKHNLEFAALQPLSRVLDEEAWRHVRCTETPEHKAAASAFSQRR